MRGIRRTAASAFVLPVSEYQLGAGRIAAKGRTQTAEQARKAAARHNQPACCRRSCSRLLDQRACAHRLVRESTGCEELPAELVATHMDVKTLMLMKQVALLNAVLLLEQRKG
jgi:hypothetical protein